MDSQTGSAILEVVGFRGWANAPRISPIFIGTIHKGATLTKRGDRE